MRISVWAKIVSFSLAAVALSCIFWGARVSETYEPAMPLFEDVTEENRAYIEYVYDERLMLPGGGGDFGVDSAVTASEAAYIAIAIYEQRNCMQRSYDDYYIMQEEYTNKALEYGILPVLSASGEDAVSREDAAALLAQFAEDAAGAGYTEMRSLDSYAYAQNALKLYNLGITLGKNAAESFSPEITLTRGDMAELVTKLLVPELRMGISMPNYEEMRTGLETMMADCDGDWSLFFEDRETGSVVSINSHQVFSASLIKLFVIQTVYERIANGQMSDSANTEELLRRMITFSDNDAWMALTRRISGGTHSAGMAMVTQVAKSYGFNDTGTFYLGHQGNYNYTSVNDCGAYLDMLLEGEIVSPEYSEKILGLMKQQQIRYKIPAGVPEGVETANKTGELDYMQGDAAIVYAPFGTYILVVIGDDLTNVGTAQENIREISRYVYDFLDAAAAL